MDTAIFLCRQHCGITGIKVLCFLTYISLLSATAPMMAYWEVVACGRTKLQMLQLEMHGVRIYRVVLKVSIVNAMQRNYEHKT